MIIGWSFTSFELWYICLFSFVSQILNRKFGAMSRMHETPKLSNQNAVFIEYDVLIGSVLLKSFMTVQAGVPLFLSIFQLEIE